MPDRILVADDNHFYRKALEFTLREWSYEVQSVSNGTAAWDVLHQPNAPRIAILDWMMPGMDGLELCRRLRAEFRHEPTYLMILTSREDKASVVKALESGADDYLTKPFDRDELQARIRVGRRIVGMQTSETVVFAFAQAVDAKSPYTRGHSERVAAYAGLLAEALSLSPAERQLLRRGAMMHDIGKICIPDAILDKPGKLTPEEYATVRAHPVKGVEMVQQLDSVHETIPIIRWHHERMDGSGYPDQLPGHRIPLLTRITSVADVYDALRSDRPYRRGLDHVHCLDILRTDALGGGLDPDLVQRFREIPDPQLSQSAIAVP